MKIINISEKKFQSLEKYNPNNRFVNTEAEIYLFPINNNKYKIFKKFFVTSGTTFSNKMFTINTLSDYKKHININEFVIPTELVSISKQISGPLMRFIKGKNLSEILYDYNITLPLKLDLLKQFGLVLEKMKIARQQQHLKDFFIGDIHEDNIIVNPYGQIKIADMDSCKITGNMASPSKYLNTIFKKNIINEKYKIDSYNSNIITPNENTDYYCYNIMILNTLFQDNITKLSLDEYYNYLDYLKYINININEELLNNFKNLYTNNENRNLFYLLDDLKVTGYKANQKIYKLKTK